jgi:hypothetical protein
VGSSRVTATGTADAAAVATSVQVRTRRPVTVVRGGRSGAQERSAAAAGTPREEDQLVRARGRSTAAQVRPAGPGEDGGAAVRGGRNRREAGAARTGQF